MGTIRIILYKKYLLNNQVQIYSQGWIVFRADIKPRQILVMFQAIYLYGYNDQMQVETIWLEGRFSQMTIKPALSRTNLGNCVGLGFCKIYSVEILWQANLHFKCGQEKFVFVSRMGDKHRHFFRLILRICNQVYANKFFFFF